MTDTATSGTIPDWDLPDRMRKALRHSGVGVQEIADYLGVNRNTVSNWINGHIAPSVQTQRLWALRTGVDYSWLIGRDGGGGANEDGLPRKDSNLQPFENGTGLDDLDWVPSWQQPYGLAA